MKKKSCEDLEEKNMNSNLVTKLRETEIEVHKQLRSPVLLYMSLKDSDEKVNNKTTNVLKDMDGMKSCGKMVAYTKCKPNGSLSLLKFDAGTIPPDVDAKIKSESKELMNMKDAIVPWKIEAHAYFGTAIELHLFGERPNFDAVHCELRSGRELNLIWDDYSNNWLTGKVPNGSIEGFHQECVVSKVYGENSSYLGPVNVNGDRMSILDREKEDELFYAVSHSSEPPQVLDI